MQDAKEKSRAAFDRQAARYDTAYFGAHARKLYPALLDQLEQLPRQRVLDVGCGTGELLRQMAARWPEGEYRGVDLSPEMVAIAREKLGRAALVVQGDSEHLPVPDGWAQVVVCSDSFHHYPDPEAALAEMARLEQHIIQIRKDEMDLLKTVQNAFGQIQNRAEEKGIRFQIRMPERAVCAHDPNWLGEALFNILDNAVKYSAPGGSIEVTLQQNEMFTKFQVRDHGLGIEAGEENQIFQRFYRGRRVTVQEGFGIGLYLAREIIRLHGGFVTAKRMEPGLLIEVDLPL